MSAVRLARGATGRDLVVKFSGCYHGHVDYLLVAAGSGLATFGQPSSQGVPKELAALTRVLPLDDTAAAEKLFAAEGERIAAVIIEPVPANNGLLLQDPSFLKTLRSLCTKHGALLIFDEVISGFRLGPGGAAAHYSIKPDLATFGKVIGGGMPVGGFAGPREAHEAPVARRRRLSGRHAVGQSRRDDGRPDDAARAAEGRRLEAAGDARRTTSSRPSTNVLAETSLDAKLVRLGSLFWIAWHANEAPRSAEALDAHAAKVYARVFHSLLDQGIALAPSAFEIAFLSLAHTRRDIDRLAEGLRAALARGGRRVRLTQGGARVMTVRRDPTPVDADRLPRVAVDLGGDRSAGGCTTTCATRAASKTRFAGARSRRRRGQRSARQPGALGRRLLPRRADRRHGRADADAAPRRRAAAAAAELSRGRVARVQEPAREHSARGRNARAALARRRRQAARHAHPRGRRAPVAHGRQSARHHAARGRPPALDAAAHEPARCDALRPSPRSPSAHARASVRSRSTRGADLSPCTSIPCVVETGLRNLLDNALKSCVAAKSGSITRRGHARRERHRARGQRRRARLSARGRGDDLREVPSARRRAAPRDAGHGARPLHREATRRALGRQRARRERGARPRRDGVDALAGAGPRDEDSAAHSRRRRRSAPRGGHPREPRGRGLSRRRRARRHGGARAPARRAVRPRRARRHDAEHGRPRAVRAAAPRRHSDAGAVL